MRAAERVQPPLSACRFPGELVRVYIWEWPVRITHWLTAFSIVSLAATGIFIGNPYLIPGSWVRDPFLMGYAKLLHSYSAIVFALSVLSRIAWMFLGNTYSHWDKFIPVARRRWHGVVAALRYYLFRLRQPPGFVGHNPLAGATYSLVFLIYLVMICTGLALYSVSASVHSPFRVFGFLLPLVGGAQTARWIHHVGMWMLLGFAVHHVYSSVLMSQVEARATVESIVSGYKFVPCDDLVYSGYRYFDQKDFEHQHAGK
jgi:Ni/Fe-hydrogenase 1 B-type cytochrome subunit